ncbi:putative enoyl-CoA hydratase echA8 [Corynebacterium provencense]|jgi:enoyl-CoA hydratase|uniref:Probable enoyl-CoA hydratase echA8 n=2 Tax=Corynebacteriaceae TaxID=1653 RepID=A0A2Z3YPX3_9CORY|nr:putative enoyl-CoA hydratase echA8 [Corynebacterium provencense]
MGDMTDTQPHSQPDQRSAPGQAAATAYSTILTSVADGVATITLNRPEALNALNQTVMEEVITALEIFDADPVVGAIVVTGSEKAFAAGADIAQMKDQTWPDVRMRQLYARWDRVTEVQTPVITAVQGFALGGGCELAMMGDIILASDRAKFGQPEIGLGVIPGMGGTQRLTRAVGRYKAMDLILTGRMMGAEEAERSGLVSRVLPSEGFAEAVDAVARKVASFSRVALAVATETVDAAMNTPLNEGMRREREAFWSLFATEDQKEGMAAFLEKRDPEWRHR